ncbi:MAG: DUF1801 domain-containing protein [Caulobacterales bacterium]|nr:DUF1801 domain-containing protein [Caulobacterales bacterium]
MASEPKTKPTDVPVDDFIASVEHPRRRADAAVVRDLLTEITGEKPVMWGPSIIGYGGYKGPTGDWPIIGFSPRKANLVLYMMNGFAGSAELLDRLGPHKTGGSCLYLTTLDKADMSVLRTLAEQSVAHMRAKYPAA